MTCAQCATTGQWYKHGKRAQRFADLPAHGRSTTIIAYARSRTAPFTLADAYERHHRLIARYYLRRVLAMEVCINCGDEIKQSNGGRKRKFCCDKCRVAYHRLSKRYANLQKGVTKRKSNTYHKQGKLHLKPITLRQANAFVDEHHSHHIPVNGFCGPCYSREVNS